jgi:hypothetical protein
MREDYCGRCHTYTIPVTDVEGETIALACECPCGGPGPDHTKDPRCKNPGHDHHDPQSPVVLSHHAIRDAEEAAEIEPPLADDEGTVCGHEKVGGVCSFWGCLCRARADAAKERPFFEVIDELDEILEETNQQVECTCDGPLPQPCGDTCQYPYADGMPAPTPAEVIYIEEAYRKRHIVHDGSPCVVCGAEITDEGHSEEEYMQTDFVRDQCVLYGCVWVRQGTVLTWPVMDWGPTYCTRCGRPAPDDIPQEPIVSLVQQPPQHCPHCGGPL